MVDVIVGDPQDYRVQGKVGTKSCFPFKNILHTTHISEAITILRDQSLRSRPIYDSSTLKRSGIEVVWGGPREWHQYRYGAIQFQLNWAKVIEGKRAYWIETAQYATHAPRILITSTNHNGRFTPYDQTQRNGPWWHDIKGDKHYMNDNYCLEFMIESNIGLETLYKINFVKHHEAMCSIHPNNVTKCREHRLSLGKSAAQFLARVKWERVDVEPLRLVSMDNGSRVPTAELLLAWEGLLDYIWQPADTDQEGILLRDHAAFQAVARSILGAVGRGFIKDATSIGSLFSSRMERVQECRRLIAECFQLNENQLPLE